MAILNENGLSHTIEKIVNLLKGKSSTDHKHTKSDITDFPTLGTASSKDVASSGNASTTQVVMGNDTRLSDARKASDVSAWAKASTKPTYTASEVGAYTKTETDTKLNGKANSSHTHGNGDITSLDAGKITSGTISIDRLPQGALDRLIKVVDDTARFKLTTKDVQLGDSVKVTSTKKMYIVVDETKLSSEDGYEPYTADSATSVPWSGVTGKPSTYTPSSHTHTKSQITDFPSSLPANGGNANTVNNHTVEADVPADAVFTDTVYDDTEVQKRISDSGYGEVAGGKNLLNHNIIDSKIKNCSVLFKNDTFYVTNKGSYSYFVLSVPTIVGKSYTVTIKDWSDYSYRCIASVSDLSDNTLVSMVITDATLSMTFTAVGTESLIQINPNNTPNEMSNTITFKCMLEEGSVATEYEPYFPSNKMLAEEKADKTETTVNLLNPTLQTTTKNGVTCTNNGDGTYTLNGTATASVFIQLDICSFEKNKTYKLLGWGNTKYASDAIGLYIETERKNVFDENGEGGFYTPSSDESLPVKIVIMNATTISNAIIKPMITTNLDATYDDFVPYTGDTGKLNSDVAKLNSDLSGKANSSHTHSINEIGSSDLNTGCAVYPMKELHIPKNLNATKIITITQYVSRGYASDVYYNYVKLRLNLYGYGMYEGELMCVMGGSETSGVTGKLGGTLNKAAQYGTFTWSSTSLSSNAADSGGYITHTIKVPGNSPIDIIYSGDSTVSVKLS